MRCPPLSTMLLRSAPDVRLGFLPLLFLVLAGSAGSLGACLSAGLLLFFFLAGMLARDAYPKVPTVHVHRPPSREASRAVCSPHTGMDYLSPSRLGSEPHPWGLARV